MRGQRSEIITLLIELPHCSNALGPCFAGFLEILPLSVAKLFFVVGVAICRMVEFIL